MCQRRTIAGVVGSATLGAVIAMVLIVVPALATPSSGVTGRSPLAPPRCSAADTRREAVLHVEPYFRYCGLARAVVYLNGKTYRIRGGFCLPRRPGNPKTPRKRVGGVAIGLIANSPAPPGRGVAFWWEPPSTRGQAVTIDDSEIEVAGMRIAASGTVVVGKRLKGGWFSLYGRDASGPTGPLVRGGWTCS